MARIPLFLLLLVAFVSLVSAAAPTFCKCTCFKNSTIIPLGPEHQQKENTRSINLPNSPLLTGGDTEAIEAVISARSASTSCSACTKAFCLSQGIKFCQDAKEEDVFTLCFQRDSNKDKIMVWGFIVGTVGLLGWAGFKRFIEYRHGRAASSSSRQDINYAPVGGGR